MVKVISTSTAGETIEFYMDGKLYTSLNKYVIPSLQLKDDDIVFVIDGPERSGKCCKAGTKVMMADGEWKNIEDVRIGDEVLSPQEDGSYVYSKVKDTNTYFSEENYNIVPLTTKESKRAILYHCSGNHLIPISVWRKDKSFKICNREARDIAKMKHYEKATMTTLSTPLISQFKDRKNCEIEPYTLGVWLGDGSYHYDEVYLLNQSYFEEQELGLRGKPKKIPFYHKKNENLCITSGDFEIIKEVAKFYPIIRTNIKNGTKCADIHFSIRGKLAEQLINLGLRGKNSGTKFIPKEALFSDADYRKRLLAGLIDTDGYFSKSKGSYDIVLKSRQLIEDIKFLVHSLGGKTGVIYKKVMKIGEAYGEYWRMSFNIEANLLPLQVPRKIKTKIRDNVNRLSIDAIQTEPCQVYGIEIDSLSQLYVTDNFMVTHNSVFAMQIARAIDKDFNLSKICFTPDEFRLAIEKANKGDCIIFDEAYTGLSSKRALSEVNHLLVSMMMQCQPTGSKVLMADGNWENIEDIKIGDEVLSPQEDGSIKFTKVIKAYKWYSEENYDVYLKRRGEPLKLYSCSWNHKIPILYHRKKLINYTAQEYSKFTRLTKNNYVALKSFPIPYFKDRKNCEIEPYTLGVWLGDGSFTKHCRIAIGTKDEAIGQEIKKYYNVQAIDELNPPTRKNYCFSLKEKLAKQLERYGLRNHRASDKFIPKEALLSDIEYRKRLLAGLIDSDGYLYDNSCYRITLKSERLVYDIADLVQSLGGKVRIYKEKYSILQSGVKARYYSVFIYIKENLNIPFILERRRKSKQKSRICNNHEIIDVKLSEKQDYVYGFTLDSPSGWYITDNWMITHNCGQKNLIILVVMPTFFMLEKYVALFRARGLFHVYRKGVKKGYFLYFNAEKKKILFLAGQKMMSYKGCRANFRGRFLNKYVIDEAKYRKLKEKALVSSSLDKKDSKLQDQRDRFIYMVWREWMKSRRNIERLCYIYGIDIKARQISTIIEGLYPDLEPEAVARKRNLILELRRRQKIKENINKSMITMKNKMEKDIKVQIDELDNLEIDENLDQTALEEQFLGVTGAGLAGLGGATKVIQDTYKRSKDKLSDTPNNLESEEVKDARTD